MTAETPLGEAGRWLNLTPAIRSLYRAAYCGQPVTVAWSEPFEYGDAPVIEGPPESILGPDRMPTELELRLMHGATTHMVDYPFDADPETLDDITGLAE